MSRPCVLTNPSSRDATKNTYGEAGSLLAVGNHMFKALLSLSFLPLLASCSANYDLSLDLAIASGIDLSAGTLQIVVSYEAPVPPSGASDDKPWGLAPRASLELEDGTREYHLDTEVCCEISPTRWIFAFVDQNDNGSYDAGEPVGADLRNPVNIESDYSATITISAP